MPFKSKAQQRFMFAAEERNDVPKGTARRWAHETPNIKKLPEKKKTKKEAYAKLASDLGRAYAQEKSAGWLDRLIDIGGKHIGWWAPAAGGAFLAGPGYRGEGALAGLLAGRLGARAGHAFSLRGLKGAPKYFEGRPISAYREAARMLGRGEAIPGLVTGKAVPEAAQALRQAGTIGALGGGAAGGYAAGRLLGAQNPYGMQPVFPGWGRENPLGIRPE